MRELSRHIRRAVPLLFLLATLPIDAPAADIGITVAPQPSAAREPENRIKKTIEIPKAAKPPAIDGKLDDDCWKNAAVADRFTQLGSDAPAKEQTTARLTYDDTALYIAFVCKESRMGEILARKTKHDDSVWQDDCVEIFLDANHDHLSYYQFIVNSLGTRQEGCCDSVKRIDQKWDGQWQAAASAHKDHWIAEVAIPFASIKAKPGCWGINLCREEHPSGELSCWARQEKRFASAPEELALFGDALFGDWPVKVTRLTTGNQGWGLNELQLDVSSRSAKSARYRIVAVPVSPPDGRIGESEIAVVELDKTGSRAVVGNYRIPRLCAGMWRIEVALTDLGSGTVYRLGAFPFQVKDPSPLSISGKVIVGPRYVVPARLLPRIGSVTLKTALCRIDVLDTKGQRQARKDVVLYPQLYPHGEAEVSINIGVLPEGRHVIAAQIVDKAGKPITDRVERTIIKIPGPFEGVESKPANLIKNPSFETVNAQGEAEEWIGAWWAPKWSGLSKVPVKDFLSVDSTTAKDGRRSIRIRSTRGGKVGTGEVLTVRMAKSIPITPGTSYKLTCHWKSEGIIGIGKIWAQTPKRQFLFKGTINGTNTDWLRHEATFTPEEGETSCTLNFSLHGKDGTLWIDDIAFAEEEASIQRLLPPNAFHPEGICLLSGNVAGKGLRLLLQAGDPVSGEIAASRTIPAGGREVRFRLPDVSLHKKHRLTAVLSDRTGRTLCRRTATMFGAPEGP